MSIHTKNLEDIGAVRFLLAVIFTYAQILPAQDEGASDVFFSVDGEVLNNPVELKVGGNIVNTDELNIPESLNQSIKLRAPFQNREVRNESQFFEAESTVRVEIGSHKLSGKKFLHRDGTPSILDTLSDHDFVLKLSMGTGDEKGVLKIDTTLRHWPHGNPYADQNMSFEDLSFEKIRDFEQVDLFGAETFGQLTTATLGRFYTMQHMFDDLNVESFFTEGYKMERVSLKPLTSETARLRRVENQIKKKPVTFYQSPLRFPEPIVGCSPQLYYEYVYQSVENKEGTIQLVQKFCSHPSKPRRPWIALRYILNFDKNFQNLNSVLLERSGNIEFNIQENKNLTTDEVKVVRYQIEGPFQRVDSTDKGINLGRGLLKELEEFKESKK